MFEDKKYGISMFFYDIAHAVVLLGGHFPPPRKYDLKGNSFKNGIKDGMIVVGNHVSFKDPWLYAAVFSNRRSFFLASELVLRDRIRTFLCTHAGCIKINRNTADIEAIRKATALLKCGRMLIVFPEGTLHPEVESDLGEVKAGAIFLASQANVPIIPCYSLKAKHWYNRRTVVVGEPFRISDHTTKKFLSPSTLDELAKKLLNEINECRKVYEELTGR